MLLGAHYLVVLDFKEISEKAAIKRLKDIQGLKRFRREDEFFCKRKRKSLEISRTYLFCEESDERLFQIQKGDMFHFGGIIIWILYKRV